MVQKDAREHERSAGKFFQAQPTPEPDVLEEVSFQRLIALERKRTERTADPFLLMLVSVESLSEATDARFPEQLVARFLSIGRETDLVGWYADRKQLGILFTGLNSDTEKNSRQSIEARVAAALQDYVRIDGAGSLHIETHLYPDEWKGGDEQARPVFYQDLISREKNRRLASLIKRGIDLTGSLAALFVLSPLMLVIALSIRLSSPGPILFRQQRVGQHGRCFSFLKFRSMVVNNDASEHRKYVEKLIAGDAERHGEGEGVFKLANDNRITPLGQFLRRTSLDELPQFINVLCGDMSLVGPRPPIPYELEAYQPWHRRRVLEARPGITGLWQVTGRSRVTFDEMVRLDLQYASAWTPWMDVKILLRTPLAVIRGSGAH